MKNIAVILAGGIGARVGGAAPKQLLPLSDGRSVLEHAVSAFEQAACIDEICIVMHPDYVATAEQFLLSNSWQKVHHIIPGGKERWESSVNAIRLYKDLLPEKDFADANILLHDAARPFVSQQIIADVCRALQTCEAVTVAVPATDTMYVVQLVHESRQPAQQDNAAECTVQSIPPRQTLMCAQTPQAFRLPLIAEAYRRALTATQGTIPATDDCGIVHQYLSVIPLHIVLGAASNRKITYKEDL
ncbi:MAG: 2-C-methyl-D-erythritol 4-phosphate cytidylyltransferase [Paludibacteraceae bacterium]